MELMRKVVYISWDHLSEKTERDWYISHLISKGVPVEFWDATNLLLGQLGASLVGRDYVITIENYEHIENLLRANIHQDAVYVLLVCYESRFYRLFRLLTQYQCKLFFVSCGQFPIQYRKKSRMLLTLITNPRRLLNQVMNKILTDLFLQVGLVKPIDVVFAAGYEAMPKSPPTTKVIPFNFCDYDNYLMVRNNARLINERYCVFLDINLGYHPDVKIAGLGEYIDPDQYMVSLNKFFDMVEKKNGVRVVIAAHPISHYKMTDFGQRTILKGVTPELVKDAEFVISHHSASISYAVLNIKPILFIYTDDMVNKYQETVVAWIKDIAAFLKAPVYNIDKVNDHDEVAIVPADEETYDRYKYGYLTTRESEGRLNRDTFYHEVLA
jgi:hypothetical protein